jgi:hypothetical protein
MGAALPDVPAPTFAVLNALGLTRPNRNRRRLGVQSRPTAVALPQHVMGRSRNPDDARLRGASDLTLLGLLSIP